MHWVIKSKLSEKDTAKRNQEIIASILKNRDLKSKREINDFLHPQSPDSIIPKEVGIDGASLHQAKRVIQSTIASQTPVIVYGDYDADGITATAIMWEALRSIGANVIPFIPSRESHGYGLSIKGLKDALSQLPKPYPLMPLIITVDNGIVAHEAVTWAKQHQITIIITDHHQPTDTLPPTDLIIHSTSICGAGVAWILATYLNPAIAPSILDLVCIGTIADMMPLKGVNRRFVKHGLEAVRTSKRPGLIALMKEAEIDSNKPIDTYHINYIIAPRLNAMGRLEHALDSLRLLCTTNHDRAKTLAHLLSATNRNRQDLTQESLEHATQKVAASATDNKIIIIDDSSYHEGVIGLIAGKIAEKFYRPAIIISRKDGISKASARSIMGVNITELIRSQSHHLIGVGGHPMAAGLSIETEKIEIFKQDLIKYASHSIDEKLLIPTMTIDCELNQADISPELFQLIQQLQPFGIGNPQPVFALHNIGLKNIQTIGNVNQHLKLLLDQPDGETLQALWFGHGSDSEDVKNANTVNLAFTINQNIWRGRTSLQLMIKDIVVT